jgi:homoserine/homoserine lactone efflux protein
MSAEVVVAFIGLEIVLCLIPGPAVLSVVGATLGNHARAGFATTAGILTGNVFYFIISAWGLATLVSSSHAAFVVIKWCGAAYLAYLGVRALLTKESDLAAALGGSNNGAAGRRSWFNGTVVQLSNPKALIFFSAILPQFIDPHRPVAMQLVVLGIAGLLVELGVMSFYIACADRIRRHGFDTRSSLWAERIGGAFLLAVAAAVGRESI